MGYVYTAMWLIVGIYLLYTGIKQYRILCFFGAYFIFLGICWGLNELLPQNILTDDPYITVIRCVSAVAAAGAILYYVITKVKAKKQADDKSSQK